MSVLRSALLLRNEGAQHSLLEHVAYSTVIALTGSRLLVYTYMAYSAVRAVLSAFCVHHPQYHNPDHVY